MSRITVACVGLVVLVILIYEATASGFLEGLNMPHLPIGVVIGVAVLAFVVWVVLAIRRGKLPK